MSAQEIEKALSDLRGGFTEKAEQILSGLATLPAVTKALEEMRACYVKLCREQAIDLPCDDYDAAGHDVLEPDGKVQCAQCGHPEITHPFRAGQPDTQEQKKEECVCHEINARNCPVHQHEFMGGNTAHEGRSGTEESGNK